MRLDRGPTGGVCLRDAVDDRGEAGRGECCTGKVEAAPARLLRVGRDELERGDQEDGGDGDVDVEDRAPVGGLGEDAADEDADGGAGSADCSPGGLRLRAGLAVKAGGDDRECRRREESGADALARASGEQGGGTCCHRRHEGRGGEDEESGEEHAAATEKVGGAAAEEQEAAEDQRVARDRPADARAAEVEVGGDVRKGDVHSRDVEDDHQLRDEQHREEPAIRRAGVMCGDRDFALAVLVLPVHDDSLSRTLLSEVINQTLLSNVKGKSKISSSLFTGRGVRLAAPAGSCIATRKSR